MIQKAISAMTVCLLAVFSFAQQPNVAAPLKIFTDQPLPVNVVSGTLRNFQFTSELNAMISAAPEAKIESVSFYLIIYHGDHVVAGEGWKEVAPVGSISRQTKLAMKPGDGAMLIVDEVVTSTRTMRLNREDITSNVLNLLKKEAFTTPPVEISMLPMEFPKLKRVQGAGTFCGTALTSASSACSSQGGIGSFSCNQTAQSFSFTCKGNMPTQPIPND
jgi:hypothetical protein